MELSKNYDPATVEDKWYKHWKAKGYFNSTPDERPSYAVVIPPPNVTGVLHMGHTLNETVQDVLIRKARMSGFNTCWVPGSDHASIATEAKVVEMLKKEKGIAKLQLTREEFMRYAFEWKDKYGGIIYNQIEKLGCSVDWKRVSFTMDPDYYKAVIKTFVDLYKKKKIYRGARMIHWDPSAKTALSDEEVEYREVQGTLYYVKYLISDEAQLVSGSRTNNTSPGEASTPNFITIATQRPETIMGDTAVCVHPKDPRYSHLKGKFVIVPLVNRKVPVIFDEYVDPEFGTGALKITPAHDINDYNLGLKHHLEIIDTLNEDGTLSDVAQVYIGVDRFEARKKIVDQLRNEELLLKEEDYQTRLGYSQRTNAVVEPRISTQWFVSMRSLADKALMEVTEGRINIHPGEKFLATYKYWLENVKDWCISRQLWWGQRIPAWYDESGRFVVAETETEAREEFKIQYSISGADLKQDEDVLDTWFSSWLWPIEVFKGISQPGNEEIKYYYPTAVLVTGQDIMFFWVARMIMAGMEYMGEKPFSDVYFTGMVRDKQGRKMSKSLGNSPDLFQMIERYGADAVRFGIMVSSPAGNDLLFDDGSPDQGRNFNNKLWNALKLVRMWSERQGTHAENNNLSSDFAISWFQNRLTEVSTEVEKMLSAFKLSEALKTIYSLIWDDFCSWYLEWVKPGFEKPIETTVYEQTILFFEDLMQLLHPFMPFITEELYHLLKDRDDDICVKQLTAPGKLNQDILNQGIQLKQDITAIRDARKKNEIKNIEQIKFMGNSIVREIYSENKSLLNLLQKQTNTIFWEPSQATTDSEEYSKNEIIATSAERTFFLHANKVIDKTAQKELLIKDLEYLKGFLSAVEKKLSNERFVQNAKPEVLALEQKKKADTQLKITGIEETLTKL